MNTNNIKANNFVNELSPVLRQVVIEIAQTIKPLLDEIHNLPPTTQNYYGDYMRILSHKPERAKIFALAMLYSGANPQGIEAAMKLI
jgi:hypothetical protein